MIRKLKSVKYIRGDIRTKTKFAWFPKLVVINNEKYLIWLESYNSHQKYCYWQDSITGANGFYWYEFDRTINKNLL